MARNLILTIRLHDGRYHGRGEWCPSPARLFQAMVAGSALGSLNESSRHALIWLESLEPPVIGTPSMRTGQKLQMYGPDNDIDALGGNLERVSEIRSPKTVEPRFFNADIPYLYVWHIETKNEKTDQSEVICALAKRLYQFGRGVDMAWATGEVVDQAEIESRLAEYPGIVYRPSSGRGKTLACPQPGSLASLEERYAAGSKRFETVGRAKTVRQLFRQAPKPRFRQVAYESPPSRRVYELRRVSDPNTFRVWPLDRASLVAILVRNGAVGRLRDALPSLASEIEKFLVGRKADGRDSGPTCLRVRIIPLPSIGHPHADHGIRRVLVEVPSGCPIRFDDVHWAFSGLELVDEETGEILDVILIPTADEEMLRHYGVSDQAGSRIWRTVTPSALPETAMRRRMDPAHSGAENKGGTERVQEQVRVAAAAAQALRHARIRARPETIRVQREPFEAKGERAGSFAAGTRFATRRLWHVETTFPSPVPGPLVIGDGRFLGLGVMAPVLRYAGIYAFKVESGLASTAQPTEVARALRRAVMARVQEQLGHQAVLPSFFTGHDQDGSPARTERWPHLSLHFDPDESRLLIIAPHLLARRASTEKERKHLKLLEAALTGFQELRAGSAGRLALQPACLDIGQDRLFAAARSWESVTPYQVTRHTKRVGALEALAVDLRAECRRRGLPEPEVAPSDLCGVSGEGLVGMARLTFKAAVNGPIILGRNRHLGGGLFRGVQS